MRDEGQRYCLVVSQCQRALTQTPVDRRVRQLDDSAAVGGQCIRELIVSMQPRDLFNHIDLAFHIQTPARDMYAELRIALALRNQGESQPLQQTEDEPRVQTSAQNPPHLSHMQ